MARCHENVGQAVELQITGPTCVIKDRTILVSAPLKMTWLELLSLRCGLEEVDENSDLFVCTAKFSPGIIGVGFTASLKDVVKDFIDKFSRKRSKYSVRLHLGPQPVNNCVQSEPYSNVATPVHTPEPVLSRTPGSTGRYASSVMFTCSEAFNTRNEITPIKPTRDFQASLSTGPIATSSKRRLRMSSKSPSKRVRNLSATCLQPQSVSDEDQFVPLSSSIVRLDESSMPLVTTVVCGGRLALEPFSDYSWQNQQARTEAPVSLVQKASSHVDRQEESYLAHVHKEIKQLQRTNVWSHVLKRSPLAFTLLAELFQ